MDCLKEHYDNRDWAELNMDVLGVILNKMVTLKDYLQFSLVCKSWYSVVLRNKQYQPSIITPKLPQLPILIVPSKDGIQNKHRLYHLTKNQTFDVDFKIPFDKRCCGSSFGWLFIVEDETNITLFNPFSGTSIRLPPITRDVPKYKGPSSYPCHVMKAILTKDPLLHPNDYMVAAIYGDCRRLCIMKPNDRTWIYLNPQGRNDFGDLNVHNNSLYVLEGSMKLWKVVEPVDNHNSSFYLKMVAPKLPEFFGFGKVYVVESSRKELLLVKRFLDLTEPGPPSFQVNTSDFYVFKLSDVSKDGIRKHVEVNSLDDDDAMFVGDNHSMCVSTKIFPKCLPNRIYYTDHLLILPLHMKKGPQDAGIFNLEDGSFGTHYITDPAHNCLPPPIWIVPTICWKDFEN